MEFIQKYARVDDEGSEIDFNNEVTQSDQEFIDDTNNFQDQEPSNFGLLNVTRDLQEAINDHSIYSDNECSDPKNFVLDCVEEIEYDFDNFKSFQKKFEKFEQDLRIFEKDSDNSFLTQSFILFIIHFYTIRMISNLFRTMINLCRYLVKSV